MSAIDGAAFAGLVGLLAAAGVLAWLWLRRRQGSGGDRVRARSDGGGAD